MSGSVGIIGYGIMGKPMGLHLKDHGFDVFVYDINEATLADAKSSGLHPCASPRELAEQADVTIIVVGFDDEVRQAVYGVDGLLEGCRAGSVVIVSSTATPSLMTELGVAFAPQGVAVADAPLIRGGQAAKDGTLLIPVGCNEATFEKIRPYLESFATDIVRLGDLGCGQVGKTLNNFLLWACQCANYEMFNVSDIFGIDRTMMKDLLLMGSGANVPLQGWGTPAFGTFRWAEKDMTILLKMSDDLATSLPLAGLVREEVKAIKQTFGLATPHSSVRPDASK